MKARTRALARRQLTWMRKLPDAALVPADGRSPEAVAADVLALLHERLRGKIRARAGRDRGRFFSQGVMRVTPTWQGLGEVQFSKWQGLGNNYIVLHEEQLPFELTPARVRLLCDRNVGIGSDGIMLIGEQTGEARFRVRIFNPDGSEAEMCGNGVRMVARKLQMEGSITGDTVVLETAAGEIVPKLGEGFVVTVDMGIARFGGEKLAGSTATASSRSLHAAGRSFTFTFVDVGNPHAVIQSPWPLELVPLHEVGPMIEEHKYFPRKANVEFVKVVERARGQGPGVGAGRGGDASLRHRRHRDRGRPGAHRPVRTRRSPSSCPAASWSSRSAGLARAHDRARRGDLPRRPLARVPQHLSDLDADASIGRP